MLKALTILLMLTSPALAQQQPSLEQIYRQIMAALSSDNARLGQENEQLKQQMQQLQLEIMRLKAKDSPKEKEKEDGHPNP